MKRRLPIFCMGILGAALVFFFGWEYHFAAAPWIALPLLVISFRGQRRWPQTLPAVLVAIAARFLSIHGGWSIGIGLEAAFAIVVNVPLFAALYLDRFFSKRLNPFFALLLFPSVLTALDYPVTFINLGMTFTLSYTQCTFLPLLQISSLLGSYAAGFLVALFAPFTALWVENRNQLKKAAIPLVSVALCFTLVLSFGILRMTFAKPQAQTVKIASISAPHQEDYWATVTDNGTPRADAQAQKPQMHALREALFILSAQAADAGAKIVFWSEGNAPLYEDEYDAFIEQAQALAAEKQVYLMPGAVVFRYERAKNDNIAVMINPQGDVAYRYEKSVSWYPTDSDGVVPVVETPYGRIATAICFDMDYPVLIHQAKNADIMLVPAMDTKEIADFHTQVAVIRGIENGFSVVRQSNLGSSIAADYLGHPLAYQNYFRTSPRVMFSDVPVEGVSTLYGTTGEIFLWGVMLLIPLMFLVHFGVRRRSCAK